MMFMEEVRNQLIDRYAMGDFLVSPTGVKTIDISPITFLADEYRIFGAVNHKYIVHELEWYKSESLNVNDIPGGPPEIWRQVASKDGFINSNYGWCVFSTANWSQYDNVKKELERDPFSRRALMIYTRPSMHLDQNNDGMQDFMCTNTVQYFIRDEQLHSHVSMRSNDAIFGYKNDYAWQQYVLTKLANDLAVSIGNIYWTAGSFHIYERHFYLVDHCARTGELSISKKEYDTIYA
jgi:thymidylate synthase